MSGCQPGRNPTTPSVLSNSSLSLSASVPSPCCRFFVSLLLTCVLLLCAGLQLLDSCLLCLSRPDCFCRLPRLLTTCLVCPSQVSANNRAGTHRRRRCFWGGCVEWYVRSFSLADRPPTCYFLAQTSLPSTLSTVQKSKAVLTPCR